MLNFHIWLIVLSTNKKQTIIVKLYINFNMCKEDNRFEKKKIKKYCE